MEEQNSDDFSKYLKVIDDFFIQNDISINFISSHYKNIKEFEIGNLKFTSADQYEKFLQNELDFWGKNRNVIDPSLIDQIYINISKAYELFDSALKQKGDISNFLNKSVGRFEKEPFIYSHTKIAQFIIDSYKNGKDFIAGINLALYDSDKNPMNITYGVFKGYLATLVFCGNIKRFHEKSNEIIFNYENTVKTATKNYEELNSRYIQSFHKHQEMVNSFKKETEEGLEQFRNNSENLIKTEESNFLLNFEHHKSRIKELEKLYEEKLKLAKPAEYWKTLSKNYLDQARRWLIASIAFGFITIICLVFFMIYFPDIFVNTEWFNVVKNSAILAVITSIAVYILRIFVKMAMSSFHLSRDALEREQLSYFYLALKNDGAITDAERGLIINSLFSRSDTGLLKGDSSPTMSANFPDVVDKISKK